MNPLPEGIMGEVYVGGERLALGYHNLLSVQKPFFYG